MPERRAIYMTPEQRVDIARPPHRRRGHPVVDIAAAFDAADPAGVIVPHDALERYLRETLVMGKPRLDLRDDYYALDAALAEHEKA